MKKWYQQQRKFSWGIFKAVTSHLFVFLIPFLVVSGIWYQTSKKSVNRQVALSLKNYLLQGKNSFENHLKQMNEMTRQITYDSSLSLKKFGHPYYSMVSQQDLLRYQNDSYMDEISLFFFEEPEKIYSSKGQITVENYEKHFKTRIIHSYLN